MANIQQVQLTDTFSFWRQRLNEVAQELNLNVPTNNYAGSGPPTATDDVNAGYSVGSLWIDKVNNDTYRCLDNTAGSAVWELTSLEISDLGSMAIQNADAVAITGGTADNIYSKYVVAIRSLLVNPEEQDGLSLILPYYNYPTDVYNNAEVKALVDTIKENQDVRCRVVINPATGPGTSTDANYAELIKLLLGAGAEVLGYVDTNYGNKQQGTIESDIDQWLTLYPYITGIYLDRLPWLDDSGSDGTGVRQDLIDMYKAITTNTHQKGLPMVMGYAGSEVGSIYYSENMVDVVIIYGSNVAPTEADLEGYYVGGHSSYSKFRKGGMVWEQASIDGVTFKELLDRVGHVLITDLPAASPFAGVPSYLGELLKMLHVWPDYGSYGFDVKSINGLTLAQIDTPGTAVVQETGNFEAQPNTEYFIDMQKAYGNRLVWPARDIQIGEAFTLTDLNDTWKIQSPILVPWTKQQLEQKITNPNPAITDRFGFSVDISGDGIRAIVGSYLNDVGGNANAGSAYIYAYDSSTSSWVLEQQIDNPSPVADDNFGYSVAINSDGTRCVIGAYSEDTGATSAGSTYIYVRDTATNTWSLEQEINNPSPATNEFFGMAVDIDSSGLRCVIAAPYESSAAISSGAIYVYIRDTATNTWSLEQEILNPNAADNDIFGKGISIDANGQRIVAGAPWDDGPLGEADVGTVYVFVRSGSSWSLEATIQNPDLHTYDYFGENVSINADGTRLVTGAQNNPTGATGAGSVFIYVRSGSSWSLEKQLYNPSPNNSASELFGKKVDVDANGTKIIAGIERDNSYIGSVAVFVRYGNDWILEEEIKNPNDPNQDYFGCDVAINENGSKFIVGAYNDDTGATDAGAVYIYESQLYKINGKTEAVELKKQTNKFFVENNDWNNISVIDDPEATVNNFGFAVDISSDGTRFIVGDRFSDVGALNTGRAYIFVKSKSGWVLEQAIDNPSPVGSDYFGNSVSINADGTRCIIGALYEDTGASAAGSVYIYVRDTATNTWSLEQEINNPTPVATDVFGHDVSIDAKGVRCIIGAYGDDTGAAGAGSVYIYVRDTATNTWSLEQEINNPAPATDDYFGYSADIDATGTRCIVGAHYDDAGATDAGAAYVFVRSGSTWTLEATINNPSPVASDYFGQDVSINADGTRCIIGAPYEDTGATNAGAVYIFTRSGSTWTLEQEINNPEPATADYFGWAVSISDNGEICAVGEYNDDFLATDIGSVSIYRRYGSTWKFEQKVTKTFPLNNQFGYSVSMNNASIIAGIYNAREVAVCELQNQESSYTFRYIDNQIGLKPKKR